ncbi:MAG: sterol desaturase family protein [Rhodothalassiaceae bacterium]
MSDALLSHETLVRSLAFAGALLLLALAEALWPRRPRRIPRARRWPVNLALVVLGTALMRLLGPFTAVAAATFAAEHAIGLFNAVALPPSLTIALCVILLDLVVYAQHVAFHCLPLLWRIHRMHHSDLELDATSGVRFHPFEYALSMLIKSTAVLFLGAPVVAVILFEILLNATAMFNHANLRLPAGVDRVLRRLVVTPDFHIVHHSTRADEYNRNFGFNLSWWDYLFGTYKARPEKGPVALEIGLAPWRDQAELGLLHLLRMPLLASIDGAVPERGNDG